MCNVGMFVRARARACVGVCVLYVLIWLEDLQQLHKYLIHFDKNKIRESTPCDVTNSSDSSAMLAAWRC